MLPTPELYAVEDGNMVPMKGTIVRHTGTRFRSRFTHEIAAALKLELGQSARSAKTIMRWTGSSERAAKYWLAGTRTISGPQLVLLAQHSDAVFQAFLTLAKRDVSGVSLELDAAEAAMNRAIAILRAVRDH